MRSALATALFSITAGAQPALAGGPGPAMQTTLIRSWQCSIEAIKPELTARMQWRVSYKPDGRFDSSGSTIILPKDWTYSIVHAFDVEGSWSIRDSRLLLSPATVTLANVTQPEGMNEEETAALRESLNAEMKLEDLQQDLLEPSTSPILELSPNRLATLDENGRDVFECRPAQPTPPQTR